MKSLICYHLRQLFWGLAYHRVPRRENLMIRSMSQLTVN